MVITFNGAVGRVHNAMEWCSVCSAFVHCCTTPQTFQLHLFLIHLIPSHTSTGTRFVSAYSSSLRRSTKQHHLLLHKSLSGTQVDLTPRSDYCGSHASPITCVHRSLCHAMFLTCRCPGPHHSHFSCIYRAAQTIIPLSFRESEITATNPPVKPTENSPNTVTAMPCRLTPASSPQIL